MADDPFFGETVSRGDSPTPPLLESNTTLIFPLFSCPLAQTGRAKGGWAHREGVVKVNVKVKGHQAG